MNDLMQKFEKKQIERLTSKKNIPTFRSGDTIKVTLKIIEGERSRLQAFEGICIARKNNSVNTKFTLRKISHGEGVERVFPLFSPIIDKIEVIRKGDTKRAKLYYLRNRKGKSARIADRDREEDAYEYEMQESAETDKNKETLDSKNNNLEVEDKAAESVTEESSKAEMKTEEPAKEDSSQKEEKVIPEQKSESAASQADKTQDEKKS
ncbi:MAG: 50S ribosomal protein L19 [Alphaproteobacteria bacterium MarineAlpha5_Bin8]|nr:MAG: 50S ribosomal protein L19 [Alphaproteobacteria bacterium MarineAlpha5_Bin8]PPR46078.1 MAG: 50S ribosomal protein L19 [Alphaproteobacteria bacterium MarineAlpha5_Bin7]|tara:strand:- start:2025 stop:2648 length:624 start_codon:yes stop_codon:yes gene_type:complete